MKKIHSFFAVCSFAALTITGFVSCSSSNTESSKDSVLTLYSEFHNFENLQHPTVLAEMPFSGTKSMCLKPDTEFGFGVGKTLIDVPSFECITQVNVSFKSFMNKDSQEPVFVLSIDDVASGKNLLWDSRPIFSGMASLYGNVNASFNIPTEFLQAQNSIKIYPWNKPKETFYIDDLKVEFVQILPKQ